MAATMGGPALASSLPPSGPACAGQSPPGGALAPLQPLAALCMLERVLHCAQHPALAQPLLASVLLPADRHPAHPPPGVQVSSKAPCLPASA